MAGNSKDVVIRFTGQNLVGPVIQGLQKQLNDLATSSRKGGGMINLTGSVGDALDAQAKLIRQQKEFTQWIRTQARQGPSTEDVARRAIARRDKWMEVFLNPDEAARGWVRYGSSSEVAFGRAGKAATNYAGAVKKAFAGLGLAGGLIGDSIGGTTGRAIGAVGNISGQAALGSMVGGPWGAAIFGSVAALKEFKGALDDAAATVRNAGQFRDRQPVNALARRQQVLEEVRGGR